MKVNSRIRVLLSLAALMISLVSMSSQAVDAAAGATAEPGAGPAASKDVEKITIIGKKSSRERYLIMRDFVSKLGDINSGFGYARLEDVPCARIKNIAQSEAEYLSARLAAAAQEAGLAAAKPGCKPNITIFFAPDGKALADYLVKNHESVLKPFGNEGGTTHNSYALHDFRTADTAVRWWQITAPVDRGGFFMLPSIDADKDGRSTTLTQGVESRLTRATRDCLLATIVIVDMEKLGEVTWDQLADYLAMVSLVQVKPGTRLAGYDTILNLFAGTSAPAALSDWDKAYLRSVYALNRNLMPFSQEGALANQLLYNLDK